MVFIDGFCGRWRGPGCVLDGVCLLRCCAQRHSEHNFAFKGKGAQGRWNIGQAYPWQMAFIGLIVVNMACNKGLQIDFVGEVAEVDERYLSVALDLGQVAGTQFWNPDGTSDDMETDVDPYDFDRSGLVTLADALAPALLRIGGTEADRLYYALDGAELDELPEGYETVLSADRVDGFGEFALETGMDLLFTLNAGPGPRNESGEWTEHQATALMRYVAEQGYPVVAWELGNEPNAWPLVFGESVSSEQYGLDMITLAAARDEHSPGAQVLGPATAYWPVTGEFIEYLPGAVEAAGAALDVATWHYYPTQSDRCPAASRPAELETLVEPANLDEVLVWSGQVAQALADADSDAQMWLGETGSAQCGGQPGVSGRWATSFWWMDQLGLLATQNNKIMVRQTLSGSDYGLVNDDTLEPTPEYWLSLLFKRHMGSSVLEVEVAEAEPSLRVYAHCHPEEGVGLLALNLGTSPVDLDVVGEMWILEAADLDSSEVLLNGETIEWSGQGPLPALEGEFGRMLRLPGYGIAFAQIVDTGLCAQAE